MQIAFKKAATSLEIIVITAKKIKHKIVVFTASDLFAGQQSNRFTQKAEDKSKLTAKGIINFINWKPKKIWISILKHVTPIEAATNRTQPNTESFSTGTSPGINISMLWKFNSQML